MHGLVVALMTLRGLLGTDGLPQTDAWASDPNVRMEQLMNEREHIGQIRYCPEMERHPRWILESSPLTPIRVHGGVSP